MIDAMIPKIFFLTISFTVGNLQKTLEQDVVNQFDNTNNMLNINTLSDPSSGRESKNDYPFYKPIDGVKLAVDNELTLSKRNTESEQFQQFKKEGINILSTNDKVTERKNDYKITSYDEDLRRSYSKESNEVDDALQIKESTNKMDMSELKRSRLMILRRPRVCYACSSINDPTCWSPNNRTIVKYCREPNTWCMSKTFQYEGTKHVIRDCGSTCTDKTNLEPDLVYKLCKTCHYDLCNSAYSVKIQLFTIFSFILFNIAYSY